MTYSIVYTSKTGNTELLAEKIKAALPASSCLYCGAPSLAATTADTIFAGFWTDKGTCNEDISLFLRSISQKKIFLFGTAGFGGSQEYFNDILLRVKAYLNDSNEIVGAYMCQGKMPQSVRARYEALAATSPEKAQSMLDNFDCALAHPSDADLEQLSNVIKNLFYG